MEHRMDQAQAWGSYLTETSIFRQAQQLSFQPGVEVALLCSEPSRSQLDDEGASREVPGGRKRMGRKLTQTPEEKRKKKIEADRNYRRNHRDEFDKLKAIASRFGGVEIMEHEINEMEAELHRLWGIELEFLVLQPEFHRFEQMKDKFGRVEEMESKLHILEQVSSLFGGIDEMVINIINHQNAQPVFGVLQQQDCHGIQSVKFSNQEQGSEIDWLEDYQISETFPAAVTGTMPDLVYSDALVTEFNAKPDENVMSNTCLPGFNDLLGKCQTLGGYTCTQSLVSNANDIFIDHSDVTRRNDHDIVEKWNADLMAEEKSLRGELENEVNEVNANESRVNISVVHAVSGLADDRLNRTVGLF